MAEPDVVIIIPSQGADLNAFADSAATLAKKVYPGRTLIVKTTVSQTASSYEVKFTNGAGKDFSFAQAKELKAVLTISHAFSGDGPNLAYHAGGYQPWGRDDTRNDLTPYAKQFWSSVGTALGKTGKIILLGCFMGADTYGTLVAQASGKPVYASSSLFAAGNAETAVSYVRRIEAGKTPAPFKRFGPLPP